MVRFGIVRATTRSPSHRRYAGSVLALFALVTLVVACKPKVGGSCKTESREACTADPKKGLACISGKWTEIECKGEKACRSVGNVSTCDQSVAAIGDACSVSENHTCGDNGKIALSCRKGKWERAATCAGARGCSVRDRDVECDNSVAHASDPCTVEGDVACADSNKATLVCRNGQFEQRLTCRGAGGCSVNTRTMQVVCDDSQAELNDACEHQDHYSCATDGNSVLRCDGRKFVPYQTCRQKTACKVQPEGVTCAPQG